MPLGVLIIGEVKQLNCEAEGKPKGPQPRKRSGTGCARPESMVGDLKPIDLCLTSLKPDESWVEGRTVADVQIARKSWV